MGVDGGSGNWSAGNGTAADEPAWLVVFDNVQLVFALIGVIANLGTLITLNVNGEDFSDIIKMLLKYQSILDCLCCLQAALLFSFKPMWKTGNTIFDTLVCHVWHSQCMFWLAEDLSTHNLVTLALERYLCVCHPLKYKIMTKGHFRKIMAGFFFLVFFVMVGTWFQINMRDGQCTSGYVWDTAGSVSFYTFYAAFVFFHGYAIPCAFFIILYGLIVLKFRAHSKTDLGASATSVAITKAQNELTKTAIVVTIIFMITLGFDMWYYIIAYFGGYAYIINSPIQKVCVFFTVLNTVANPFLYASFMPMYLKSVKKTFFTKCTKT